MKNEAAGVTRPMHLGLIVQGDGKWIGGLEYIRNLGRAILAAAAPGSARVTIFTGRELSEEWLASYRAIGCQNTTCIAAAAADNIHAVIFDFAVWNRLARRRQTPEFHRHTHTGNAREGRCRDDDGSCNRISRVRYWWNACF